MKTNKNVWANLCKSGLAVMAVSAFVSCGNNKEFTTRNAEKAIEDLPMFQDSANVINLQTGYYELNDATMRHKLRQLVANEMITYSAEQINEYIPATYWSSEKINPHVFVTVALTEKGKKLIVTEPIKDKDSEELKNKNKEEKYPESGVAEKEQIPVRNPDSSGSANVEIDSSDSSTDDNSSNSSSTPYSGEESLYQKALNKVNTTVYDMLCCKVEVYKVKNLICTEESMKEGKATCNAILEFKDVTPFGRILGAVINGDRKLVENIQFFYCIDKGWQVRDESTSKKD